MADHPIRVEIFSLLNFKRLAENESNHVDLINDKRIINYVERGLQTSDEEVITTSLRILELLAQNPKSCDALKKIESVKISLRRLTERRFGVTPNMRSKAERIFRVLDSTVKPLTKEKLTWPRKVITLQVTGLHGGTRKDLEDILTKRIKGVLTVMVDVEHQRCTVTVYSHVEPKDLAEAIAETGYLNARQVVRNKNNQEILVPLVETISEPAVSDLPEYLEEEDEAVVEPKAVTRNLRVAASEWFLTTAGFIQRSMYW